MFVHVSAKVFVPIVSKVSLESSRPRGLSTKSMIFEKARRTMWLHLRPAVSEWEPVTI